ncbi:MAG: MBL fold metallo-hydrolase [Methanobacteriota archaeon]
MPERIVHSATVLVWRGADRDGEVFLVERPAAARFFAGHHVFPGGVLDKADGDPSSEASFRACAVRELAEESGVHVGPDDLEFVASFVTPPFAPIRFHTRYYLARVSAETRAHHSEGELVGSLWMSPAAAVRAFEQGALRIPPPSLHVLRTIAAEGLAGAGRTLGAEEGMPWHRRFPIELAPNLCAIPLATRTLPPYTHTNCYLAGGTEFVVVDPGSGDREEADRLTDVVDLLIARGREPVAIVLTHHHGDHVGGVARIRERFGLPVWMHEATAAARPDLPADRLLTHGEALPLGRDPYSGGAIAWRVLHTPGHAPGHVALHEPEAGLLLCGDLVAGFGTVVIPPGEGDMGAYYRTLEALGSTLGPFRLFPAHGPQVLDGRAKLVETLAHRRAREAAILAAVSEGATTIADVVKRVYTDVEPAAHELARLNVRAHLSHLVREGKVAPSLEAMPEGHL